MLVKFSQKCELKPRWVPLWKINNSIEFSAVEEIILNKIKISLGIKDNDKYKALEPVLDSNNKKILRFKIFIDCKDNFIKYDYYFFPFICIDKGDVHKNYNNYINNDSDVIVNSYNVTVFNEKALFQKIRAIIKDKKVVDIKKEKI